MQLHAYNMAGLRSHRCCLSSGDSSSQLVVYVCVCVCILTCIYMGITWQDLDATDAAYQAAIQAADAAAVACAECKGCSR